MSDPFSYSWNYAPERADLRRLYEKAKREQWISDETLAWSVEVDPELEILPDMSIPIYGSDIWNRLTAHEKIRYRHEAYSWMLSQFLHGEQGALLATSQIVATVPFMDAKLYAATQAIDEARHVEVYERYLREKVELLYPHNPHLKQLLDTILADSRWDMKYLGMQILVEGLALAAFRFIHDLANEPLIRQLTHHVMRDEARHVAFGVLSLRDFYQKELNEAELREREEFVYQASILMRDRFVGTEVFEKMGLPVEECRELAEHSPAVMEYRKMLFSRIVPNVKRLGLLSPWMKEKFHQLDILKFEDLPADA